MRIRRPLERRLVAAALFLAWSAVTTSAQAPSAEEQTVISRIYWCIHPYCWSMYDGIPADRDPELWKAVLGWELDVHDRHMAFVSNMKPDEALIIYPIGSSEPMTRLMEHAREKLGKRCIVPTWQCVAPTFLDEVEDPIRRFLDDRSLPGRQQFVQDMVTDKGRRAAPEGLAEELEAEIRDACSTIGHDWSHGALKVIYYNRVLAIEIQEELRRRGLAYDPKTVQCVAFGEGLEQCAMTWKSMLPHYMGLGNPIENDPTLSVSGAAYLVGATFKERVKFDDDVRLLLWAGSDGRPIGLFYRTAVRLKDPELYAHVPLEGLSLEVWVMNDKVWSARATGRLPAGHLHVPVFMATRTGRGNNYYYLIGDGIPFQEFRDRLASVTITPDVQP